MVFTKFLRPEARQSMIDTREAANLWDILKAKYDILEYTETNLQLAHDIDLKLMLEISAKHFQKDIKNLESLLKKYQIKGPDQNRLASNWASNAEITRDEYIATSILTFVQEHIENSLRASRTSITNDHIRRMFMDMAIETLHGEEKLVKYLKLKGWIDTPPLYLNSPAEINEKVCAATASQLWDHVTFRYDNIRKTNLYLAVANDPEFKLLIKKGLERLDDQVKLLENECQKFGISLPKRPPEVVVAPAASDLFDDDQIYRDVLQGLQVASLLHVDANKKCVTNSRVRSLFRNMLIEEINYYDKFVKYGKLKSWLNDVPIFRIT